MASLDASFGTGGVTHVAVPPVAGLPMGSTPSFEPAQVLRLLDGRLVVVGQDPSAVVLRLTASGALDPTFGDGGIARLDLAVGALAALQPDGAVVVSGTVWSSSMGFRWVVARLGVDGRLDPGFGRGGIVEVPGTSLNGGGLAAGLLSDGRIVAYGRAPANAMLIRLTPQGVPDLSSTAVFPSSRRTALRDGRSGPTAPSRCSPSPPAPESQR
jgi:uncharacterized delta-60 repeat protein